MRRLRSWLIKLLLKDDLADLEREIREEFHFHLEMKTASLTAKGMDPEAARALAEECFGDTRTLLQAGVRNLSSAQKAKRRKERLDWLGQDLKDGVRRLARNPGFSLLAIGTLALGLSTSAAVFTYVNAYQRPFPGADIDGAYQVFQGSEPDPFASVSYLDFLDLAEEGEGLFELVGAWSGGLAGSARFETLTEVVFGQAVSGGFFSLLGVEMALGRRISPEDDQPGASPVMVISHRYWLRRFGAEQSVLGSTFFFNNQPYTVVGVAAPSFLGSVSALRPDVWIPFEEFKRVYRVGAGAETDRETGEISPYLRLHPGVDAGAVEELLTSFAESLDKEVPLENRSRRFFLEPATWIQPAVRNAELPTTRIMGVAAAALLLLACANVANLFLSSGMRRGQEMAVRSAMGASRFRLVRQLLAENLFLSLLAGGLALVVAGPAAQRLSSYFARPSVWGVAVPREITVDYRVLGFGILIAAVVGILTGILPALSASKRDPTSGLICGRDRSSKKGSSRKSHMWGIRDFLVSAQIALSVVLLVLAGLVVRTLDSAKNVDPGFDTEWTLASFISTSSMGTPTAERGPFFNDLIARFEGLPWVTAAAVSEDAPLSPHPISEVLIPGSAERVPTVIARVVPGYFEAMGMEVLRGRSLMETDSVTSPGRVVVNEALAEYLGDGTDPLERSLTLLGQTPEEARDYQVVGVVESARLTTFPEKPGPVAFFLLPQDRFRSGNAFLLKVSGDPAEAVRRTEEELHAVDPRIAIVNIIPYSEVVEGFLYSRRMNAELFSVIAILGLLLAAAGVFGVMSLYVARQRREIGIRLAIGADSRHIVRLVGLRATVTVLLGLAIGLAVALAGAQLVEGLLWGVGPADPISLGVGITVLVSAAIVAAAIPIVGALRVDPVQTLLPD